MTEEKNNNESTNAEVGSSIEHRADPNNLDGDTGESAKKEEPSQETNPDVKTVPESMYKDLEKKIGEQGNELGKYRDYVDEISPLLEKLENQPEIVEAILQDKISPDLIKAVSEGKVSIEDAKDVTEAHKEVKKELGKEKYDKTSSDEINKLISSKLDDVDDKINKAVSNIKNDVNKSLTEAQQRTEYENKIKDFIKNTPDYEDLADDVNKYLNEHPKLDDIEIAYHAVKGQKLSAEKKADEEKRKAEESKNIAANASGGSGKSSGIITDPDEASNYIASSVNPNRL